jgi:hypothetical protein
VIVALLQVERLGHRWGAGRLAQLGQAEELLRGAEQGVVVEQRAGPAPVLVLGLMTRVATRQLTSVVLVAQCSPLA